MNQKHRNLLWIILPIMLLAGCSQNTAQPQADITPESTKIEEQTTASEAGATPFPTVAPTPTHPFQEMGSEDTQESNQESLGAGGLEWWLDEAERGDSRGRQVTYTGDPIEVNYRFHGAHGINEAGFFILVDGFVQPYQVVATDQKNNPPKLNQEIAMARINLPDGDEVEMRISFFARNRGGRRYALR